MHIVKRFAHEGVEGFLFGFGPVGKPLMSVHLYAVDDLLIDTGQHNMQSAVLHSFRHRRIDRILLTHHHEDHSGNAAALSRQNKAPVFGHPLAAEKLRRGYRIFPYQHYMWGKTQLVPVTPCPASVETEHYRFDAIHTPGHSKDHLVYLEKRQGWLFSGDLYLGDKIKYFRADEHIYQQIESIRKVLSHEFGVIFCAHHPVLENGGPHLKRKLEFLENFTGEILHRKNRGDSLEAIIRQKRRHELRMVKWICMGNVSYANMIRSAYRDCPSPRALG